MTEYECRGGPLDGQVIADRGLYFTTIATMEERGWDGIVTGAGWSSGIYERRPDGYHWRAR